MQPAEAVELLQAFLAEYGAVEVDLDGIRRPLDLPEVDTARAALAWATGERSQWLPWVEEDVPVQLRPRRWLLGPKVRTLRTARLLSDPPLAFRRVPQADLWVATTPLTWAHWDSVMGRSPAVDLDPACPAEGMSWLEAVVVCNRYSASAGLEPAYALSPLDRGLVVRRRPTGGFRLPTPAEWELAARAGQSTAYPGSSRAQEVAWFAANSEGHAHPVGQKRPNALGLFDLSGNVWEWVWDPSLASEGAIWLRKGYADTSIRSARGGSWATDAIYLAVGHQGTPEGELRGTGMRMVRGLG